MTCDEARTLLLEADLADLRGESSTGLANHIRACSTCRVEARRILAAEAALANVIAARRPRRSADVAAGAARVTAHQRRRVGRRLSIVIPALAAAGIALVVTLGRDPALPSRPLAAAMPPPVVEAAPGRNVIVFDTGDPKITVVWVY